MVSVILPAYNAQPYLNDCVSSILHGNAVPGLDIILVDDGSNDNTGILAANLGCRVFKQPRRGAAAARNKGLAEAPGPYVFFLDADDLLMPGSLAAMLSLLESEPRVMAVFGKAVEFVSPELAEDAQNRFRPRRAPFTGCLPGCALLRKAIFTHIGLFDQTMRTGETVAWQMRMRDSGVPFLQTDVLTLRRRLHPRSTGAMHGAQEKKDYLALLRKRMRS